jgi:GntR family transcriptional regulator
MIRLWLSREQSIPIREQLSAQRLLGILSRRLAPGERLPSVRQLARHLKVHPNTVSAAYRDLAARGWVSRKRGSGVYVQRVALRESPNAIDDFARAWLEDGLAHGFTIDALETALEKVTRDFRTQMPAQRFLVVHPDRDLSSILAAEIEEALGCPVLFAGLDDAPDVLLPDSCVLMTAACESRVIDKLRPAHYCVIGLNAMEEVLAGHDIPRSPVLVGIVSRSQSILEWSSTLLPALGPIIELLKRNPREPGWKRGLAACDIVAADVKAALELPKRLRPIVFRIVSTEFLAQARQLVTVQKP